jgi:hypothetical protein
VAIKKDNPEPLRLPHKNDVLVRLYLQLFVGVRMFYLRYLCLYAHSGVQHKLCCFLFFFALFFSVYVASFSGLSFLIATSVFFNVYLLV